MQDFLLDIGQKDISKLLQIITANGKLNIKFSSLYSVLENFKDDVKSIEEILASEHRQAKAFGKNEYAKDILLELFNEATGIEEFSKILKKFEDQNTFPKKLFFEPFKNGKTGFHYLLSKKDEPTHLTIVLPGEKLDFLKRLVNLSKKSDCYNELKFALSSKDKNGNTPLHLFAKERALLNSKEFLIYVLSLDLPMGEKNNNQKTISDVALEIGDKFSAKILMPNFLDNAKNNIVGDFSEKGLESYIDYYKIINNAITQNISDVKNAEKIIDIIIEKTYSWEQSHKKLSQFTELEAASVKDFVDDFSSKIILPYILLKLGIEENPKVINIFSEKFFAEKIEDFKSPPSQLKSDVKFETYKFLVNNFDLDEIINFSIRWHQHQATFSNDVYYLNNERYWNPLVEDFQASNNLIVKSLTSSELLKKESDQLGHCVGRGTNYISRCCNFNGHILSIQDSEGNSFSTVEIRLSVKSEKRQICSR